MINVMGVRLSIHPVFVLIMMLSVLTGRFIELLTLFAIVFIHELGHASCAALLGIRVTSIQMLPFGGVATIEDRGDLTASKEILISLAGPFQNILMIVAALAMQSAGFWDGEFLHYFISSNLIIALFNLLPVLPLDGGKIVQAVISIFLPYHRTLLVTYKVSIIFSALIISYAVLPLFLGQERMDLNLLMMGSFLIYSNIVDYRNIPYRFVRFLMNRDVLFSYHAASGSLAQPIISLPAKPLDNILRLFKREKYHMIYVMDAQGKIVGVLPEQRIIESYFDKRG
ncbi:M50 family metallopeptidase [Neobacillus mesonae]|nr:M50 family metallopeptidase [Neobacillus mesonae]